MSGQVWAPSHHYSITVDPPLQRRWISKSSIIAFTITLQEAGRRGGGSNTYSEDLVVDRRKDSGISWEHFNVTSEFRKAFLRAAYLLDDLCSVDICASLGFFQVDTAIMDEVFLPTALPAVLIRVLRKQEDPNVLVRYVQRFKDWMDSEYDCIEDDMNVRFPETALLIVAQPESCDEEVVIGDKRVKKVQGLFSKMEFFPQFASFYNDNLPRLPERGRRS